MIVRYMTRLGILPLLGHTDEAISRIWCCATMSHVPFFYFNVFGASNMKKRLPLFFVVFLAILVCCVAVDRSKFRTCYDTGFCRRHRNVQPTENLYNVVPGSITVDGNGGKVVTSIGNKEANPLTMEISFLQSGSVRVKISESTPRWQPVDLLVATSSVLSPIDVVTSMEDLPLQWKNSEKSTFSCFKMRSSDVVLVLQYSPFRIELYQDGNHIITMNNRNMMHFEQSIAQIVDKDSVSEAEEHEDRHQGKEVIDYGEDGLAIYADGTREEKKQVEAKHREISKGESFGGHHDTMPHGPRSVGIDFAFPCGSHVYGIPEHSTSLSLPTTAIGSAGNQPQYSQPFRLYNLDVFEYELQETMALYGNIPLMWAHGKCGNSDRSSTSGMFWFNPSESFVDVSDGKTTHGSIFKESHWISESGEIDVFLLPGPTPKGLMKQYSSLTGTQQLPPLFSLGYHQCRWNYRDEKDVAAVNSKFEELDYPYDVLWLDIEHTNGKRYFTWDKHLFPSPLEMQKNITRVGRKMVTIIDPHIKRDDNFHIHKEATAKGLYIKDKTGKDFDGWCWPGSSSYLDFTNPKVRQWWAEQFTFDKYVGSTLELFTWNDMNEPSVFNGPEVSMQKDARNLDGIEHREWHNLYGIYMQMATAQGQLYRCATEEFSKKLRPFVLTRAFWAGSQRFGAMWTGDNTADWGHLKIAAPMLLSINLGGLSFAGADVGGFFGEPSAELFTRWYQAGAFTPFFRGHAHHDTKRREPWLYGELHTTIHRNTAILRYSLLPYWYSVFFEAFETGMPVMRAMFIEYPELIETYAMDDQWMIGESLLVKPVTEPGSTSVNVFFPPVVNTCSSQILPWYDLETLQLTPSSDKVQRIQAELAKIPAFVKPGTILTRKMRVRRSSKLMYYDPYTLFVFPGSCGAAHGELYLDDEHSLAHEMGMFSLRKFSFNGKEIRSTSARSAIHPVASMEAIEANPNFSVINTVERIVLAGQAVAPNKITIRNSVDSQLMELQFLFDRDTRTLTIKKPDVRVMDDWIISLDY